MFGRAKLKAEIVRLQYRVAELEDRLCPCEEHDWKEIGWELSLGDCGVSQIYTYKCRKCGKIVTRVED
jgi:hypothetical protein